MDESLLKKIPLFAEVPDDDLRKVATFATTEEFTEGAAVVKEGDYSNHFYAIQEGTVKVEREASISPTWGRATCSASRGCSSGRNAPPAWWRPRPSG